MANPKEEQMYEGAWVTRADDIIANTSSSTLSVDVIPVEATLIITRDKSAQEVSRRLTARTKVREIALLEEITPAEIAQGRDVIGAKVVQYSWQRLPEIWSFQKSLTIDEIKQIVADATAGDVDGFITIDGDVSTGTFIIDLKAPDVAGDLGPSLIHYHVTLNNGKVIEIVDDTHSLEEPYQKMHYKHSPRQIFTYDQDTGKKKSTYVYRGDGSSRFTRFDPVTGRELEAIAISVDGTVTEYISDPINGGLVVKPTN